jgi:hypothetical protein
MRKLLMATAAMVGASLGMANAAQVFTSQPGSTISTSSQGTNLSVPAAQAPSPATPAPGQIVVRLDLRENVYLTGAWGSADSVNGNKQQPLNIIGYPRFYTGFDGMATNGLKYGMFYEFRIVGNGNFSTGSSGNPGISGSSNSGTVFWRRDYGYVGTAQAGTLRMGQTDGPMSLFLIGTFDDFATGLFNGDINDAGVGAGGFSGVVPWWPFPDVGNEYTSAKVVYLSPAFAGFDFGVSYEPSSANLVDSSSCTLAAPGPTGCVGQSTSSNGADLQRRRNTIEAGIRYRGAFSGLGVAGSLITMQGGHIDPNDGAATSTSGGPLVSQFNNLSVYDAGLALTFAGATVGGNVIWGQYNGQWAPKPAGGANSVAWIAGAEYTWGPAIVGGSYFSWTYQGALGIPTQRHDSGLAFGLTYNLAPGLAFLAEYMYGQRHQGNYNFVENVAGVTCGAGSTCSQYNNVQTQIVGAGFQFRW